MAKSKSMPQAVNKISVLQKMNGFDKKKAAKNYVVPNNSALNLHQKSGIHDPLSQPAENTYDSDAMNKCPHCENMAKNFLYLESLIRNNCDKGQKCSLCNSSLKYLQYINRNIMQVFGNFDSVVRAARAFSKQAPLPPKYSVVTPQPSKQTPQRAKGGALITMQKSAKNLKSKSKPKTVKAQKSNKSLKSVKSAKSGKSLSKCRVKVAGGPKKQSSHGKMMLKRKFRSTKPLSQKMVRSASQYHSLNAIRSKMTNKAKKLKKLSKRPEAAPTSINWGLLKKNMPKRSKLSGGL